MQNSQASSTWGVRRSPIMSRCWSRQNRRPLRALSDERGRMAGGVGAAPSRCAGALDRLRSRRGLRHLARRAAAIGAALAREYGIAPGDRVGLFATNCTQYLECLYGIWWRGAVAIPINAKLHGREAAWICSDAGAKLTFVSDDTAEALMAAKADLPVPMETLSVDSDAYRVMRDGEGAGPPLPREADDLAWLFYTSGTTGRPKGVMLSHGNLVAMSLCYLADVDHATPDDVSLYAAPISHGAGLYNFPHVRMGGRHVIPESGGFDPDEVLNLGRQLDNVIMFAAPTMVRRLVDA